MKFKMSRTQEIMFLLTLFLSNTIVMGDSIISPTVSALYTKFPDNAASLNFIVSGCYFLVIFLSIAVAKLSNKMDMKLLMIIGALFGVVSGVGMMFSYQPLFMAVMRALFMVSYAITMNVGMAMLTEAYTDDDRRNKVFGYYNASFCAVGAILSLAAGTLATKGIGSAYKLNAVIILYAVMLLFFVPSFKPEAGNMQAENTDTGSAAKGKLGSKFWFLTITYTLIYTVAFASAYYYVSMYISENNLGNEATTGIVNAFLTFVGFLTPLGYGFIAKKLGRHVTTACYVFSLAGCVLLMLFPSKAIAFIGYGLLGGSSPLLRTDVYANIPLMVPEDRINDAIGYIGALMNVGGCTCGYLMTFTMSAFGLETFTRFLIVPVIFLVVALAMDIFTAIKFKEA